MIKNIFRNPFYRFNYIDNYPEEYRGRKLIFEKKFTVGSDIVNAICVDDITKKLALAPATIEGIFENKEIHFMKHYPCAIILVENKKLIANHTKSEHGFQYVGVVR